MGMDVFGKSPASAAGEYFRRNVWGWRPLAQMILTLCPDETKGCSHWQSNDGDGLDGVGALALAAKLEQLRAAGQIEAYCKVRDAEVAALPRHECPLCKGTGVRSDKLGVEMRQPERIVGTETGASPDHPRLGERGWCNGCGGLGAQANAEACYDVTPEDVDEFVAFLKDSGGFEIC